MRISTRYAVTIAPLGLGLGAAFGDEPARLFYDVDEPTWPSPGQGSPPDWSNDSKKIIFRAKVPTCASAAPYDEFQLGAP